MNSAPSTPDPPSTAPPRDSETRPAEKPISIVSALLLVLGLLGALFVSFIKAIARNGGFPYSAEGWGYVTGTTLAPFITSCITVGIYYTIRKDRRTPRRVATYVVVWALLFAFASGRSGTTPKFPNSEQEMHQSMARAAREAAGLVPPEEYSRDDLTVTMRGVFREIIQFNQQYVQGVGQFHTPELQDLYSTASFREAKVIEETIRQLKNMAAFEEKYSSTDPWLAKIRAQIKQKNWPTETKTLFLDGFEEGMRQSAKAREENFRNERQWIEASIDLYSFALDNYSKFSIRKNRILVNNSETLAIFNQKLSRATQLHEQVLQAQARVEQEQKAMVEELGINPSDLAVPSR
jgi:hypothetical protein